MSDAFDVAVSKGSALRKQCQLDGENGEGLPLSGVTELTLSVKRSTNDPDEERIIAIDHKDFTDPEDDPANGLWYMNVPGTDTAEAPATYRYQWTAINLPPPFPSPYKFPETPAKFIITPTCDEP